MRFFYLFKLNNTLLRLYLAVLVWISLGIMVEGSGHELLYLAGYGLSCIAAFSVFYSYFQSYQFKWKSNFSLNINTFIIISFSFVLVTIIAQIVVLGKIPILTAAFTNDYHEITLIRQQITIDSPSWVNYLTSICIRSFLPLLVMLTLFTKRTYLFWFSVMLGTFFCCAMMQKSYIALVFIPAFLMALIKHEWKKSIVLFLIALFSIYLLTEVVNPWNRPDAWNTFNNNLKVNLHVKAEVQLLNESISTVNSFMPEVKVNSYVKQISTLQGIVNRVFIMPGQVVSEWFSYIPSKIPYGKGCGDRVLAKLLHCTHINYSEKIYKELFPEQVKDHIFGTVNAASFMEWYANFGLIGLVIAGIEMGFWLAFISIILGDLGPILIAVNAIFVVLLSSVSFHTLLLSGGWMLTIILVYLLRNTFNENMSQGVRV